MSFLQSKNKAIYIDTFSINTQHENFNASVLHICNLIFYSVSCICDQSSFLNISKITSLDKDIEYSKAYVIKGSNKYCLLLRYLFGSVSNIIYIIFAPKDSILVFPFNNLFSLKIINWLNRFLNKKILIFCHGELEGLVEQYNPSGLLAIFLKKLAVNFFSNSKIKIHKSIHFVILGDKLFSNLSDKIESSKISNFITMDHPYFFDSKGTVIKPINEKSCCLGTIGSMTNEKGYLTLIKFLKNIEKPELFEFKIIGKINANTDLIKKIEIKNDCSNKELSRGDFNKKIESLDYILFFYSSDSYKLTASGAVFDSILHEKPILALKNDYFEYLFKKFGPFGYLYNNIDQMIKEVPKIVFDKNINSFDFTELKKKLSPNYIAHQLHSELIKIHFI